MVAEFMIIGILSIIFGLLIIFVPGLLRFLVGAYFLISGIVLVGLQLM